MFQICCPFLKEARLSAIKKAHQRNSNSFKDEPELALHRNYYLHDLSWLLDFQLNKDQLVKQGRGVH